MKTISDSPSRTKNRAKPAGVERNHRRRAPSHGKGVSASIGHHSSRLSPAPSIHPAGCSLRQRLRQGERVLGSWLNSASPIMAELMSSCEFDFVCLDAEHSPVDVAEAQIIFQAIRSGCPSCVPVVRTHGVDYALVKRYVDAGARGVIAPLVNSREEAQILIEAVKYPPIGNRGVGFCRANLYGARLASEFERANDEIFVAVQIEHIDAVRNIDAILSLPEIDAAFIGPYDLTASMGIAGAFDHKDYRDARRTILRACQKHRVAPGIHVVQPDMMELSRRVEEGFRLLAYSLDIAMVMSICRGAVSSFRELGASNNGSR